MSNAKAILAGFGLIAAAIAAVGPNQRAESQRQERCAMPFPARSFLRRG
jgi:hypothetical protein